MKQYRFVIYLFITLLVSLLPLYADPSKDLHHGKLLFEVQKYDEAAAYFENLCIIFPDSASVAFNLGKNQLASGDYKKAVNSLEKAERIYRLSVKMDKTPLNLFTLAGYYMRRKQFDKAIPLLKEFLTMDLDWLDPKKAGAYFMLGMLYEKKRMPKESENAFKYALKNKPDKWMEKEIGKKLKAM